VTIERVNERTKGDGVTSELAFVVLLNPKLSQWHYRVHYGDGHGCELKNEDENREQRERERKEERLTYCLHTSEGKEENNRGCDTLLGSSPVSRCPSCQLRGRRM